MKPLSRNSNHNPPLNSKEWYLSKKKNTSEIWSINNLLLLLSFSFYKMRNLLQTLNHFDELALFTLEAPFINFAVPFGDAMNLDSAIDLVKVDPVFGSNLFHTYKWLFT